MANTLTITINSGSAQAGARLTVKSFDVKKDHPEVMTSLANAHKVIIEGGSVPKLKEEADGNYTLTFG